MKPIALRCCSAHSRGVQVTRSERAVTVRERAERRVIGIEGFHRRWRKEYERQERETSSTSTCLPNISRHSETSDRLPMRSPMPARKRAANAPVLAVFTALVLARRIAPRIGSVRSLSAATDAVSGRACSMEANLIFVLPLNVYVGPPR